LNLELAAVVIWKIRYCSWRDLKVVNNPPQNNGKGLNMQLVTEREINRVEERPFVKGPKKRYILE
jgi:hypothetical protein